MELRGTTLISAGDPGTSAQDTTHTLGQHNGITNVFTNEGKAAGCRMQNV